MEPNSSRKPPPLRLPKGASPMVAPPLVAQRDHDGGDCPRGYQWYTCNTAQGIPYRGCCAVDPCRPDMVDCPDRYKPQLVTSSIIVITSTDLEGTSTVTETNVTTITSSASSEPVTTQTSHVSSTSTSNTSASSTTSATTTATFTPDAPPTVVHKDLSVSAIVGIAVGCSLAFIFFAISVCMWWGRRRAKKPEKTIAETANVSSFLGPTDRHNPAETGHGESMSQSGSSFPHGNYQPVPTGAPYEYRGRDLTSSGSTTNTTWPGSPMDYERHRFSGATTMSTPASHNSGGTPVTPNFPSRGASELDSNQAYQQGGWGPTFEPMHEIPELEGIERPPEHSQGPNN